MGAPLKPTAEQDEHSAGRQQPKLMGVNVKMGGGEPMLSGGDANRGARAGRKQHQRRRRAAAEGVRANHDRMGGVSAAGVSGRPNARFFQADFIDVML